MILAMLALHWVFGVVPAGVLVLEVVESWVGEMI